MVENNEHDCRQFAEARQATLRKPYHFVDCGLPNVYLAGIRYFVCRKCGKRAAEIPAVKQLLTNIAAAVVEQEGRLTGAEIRFLRSEEHTSELQSRLHLVCRLLLEKKKKKL